MRMSLPWAPMCMRAVIVPVPPFMPGMVASGIVLKSIRCAIHAGGSIGLHKHETSDDVNYVLSGTGKAICDGKEESLAPGTCHICKKGSEHSIVNTGEEDLVLLTVVIER